MIDRYYQQELAHLKELAAEFAEAHPALAPMLGGAWSDPDVERLFEGMALQFALLREKIDDDFPEFIQPLARQLCPQFLRPIPSATIVDFSPKETLAQPQTIPAGTELASVPVDGVRCLFRTCAEVELHPLELLDASFIERPGEAPLISLSLSLNGISLAQWSPRSLRLFLSGDWAVCADLYLLLRRYLRRIVLSAADGGKAVALPATSLAPAGFATEEQVIPYPPNGFPGFRLLQEYFTIPQRFLFLDLEGWERWSDRGSGRRFRVDFELEPSLPFPPRIKKENFTFFAVPAVNLFSTAAEPISLDHSNDRYQLRPEKLPPDHAQVFSVDQVTGLLRGTNLERRYHPRERFRSVTAAEPAYRTITTPLPARAGFGVHLSFCHGDEPTEYQQETISASLTCTNGDLAARLCPGDLCEGTSSSPECASFRNITSVTSTVMPPLGKDLLWRLVSHLNVNLASLRSAQDLKELLEIYLFEEGASDQSQLCANRKRIQAIESMECLPADRLVRGIAVRGSQITLRVSGEHFSSSGDLFLFGCMLDQLLAGFATLNTFTRLTIQDLTKGETIQWQPRLGEQPLL